MMRRGGRHPARDRRDVRVLAAVLATGLAALLPVPAVAQDPLPEDNAGTDQYIEPVPDAGGDRRAEPGSRRGRDSLPPETRDSLPPGEEGRILGEIATDPGAGAPQDTASARGGDGGGRGGEGDGDGDGNGGAGAAGTPPGDDGTGLGGAVKSAVVDSDSPVIPILLLALLGMALAALFVRFARRGS